MLQDYLAQFLVHLELHRGLSAHTIRAYKGDLEAFDLWLTQQIRPNPNPEQAEAIHEAYTEAKTEHALSQNLERYMMHLGELGFSRAAMARKASSLKSFMRYLLREGHLSPEAPLNLNFFKPRLGRRLPRFLTADDIEKLRQVLQTRADVAAWVNLRDEAILLLLFTAGLRVSELVSLNLSDIDLEQGEIRVWGKGGKQRIAFASAQTVALVNVYRQATELRFNDAPEPLLLNQRGKRLTDRSIHRLLAWLGQAAGFHQAIHPHLLRHSFATFMLNKGADLRIVQELLGHASVRSTQIYTHVSTERLRQVYLAAHPRGRA